MRGVWWSLVLVLLVRSPFTQAQENKGDEKSLKDNSDLMLLAGADFINASWLPVSSATSYIISWTPGDNGGTHTVDGGDNTKYNITGLQPCTDYTVTVQPMSDSGKVDPPLTATTTTTTPDPDPYLQNLMAAKVMDQSSQLFVNWTAAQGVGNCVVTYRITWSPVSEGDGSGTSYNTSLSHTITQLEAWTTYHVCVASRTKTDYSQDKCTNGRTDEDKPGPPVIMSVEPAPSSSLRVKWSTPEKPNGVITIYTITWTWEGHMDHTITPDNTYTTTDLLPCTTYSVTVRAATSKGYGPESDPLTGTTYRVDPDPYLQDVMAAKVMDQSSQLFVNWTAAQGVGNCVVTYRITWRPVSEGDGSGTSYTTSLSHTITQLEAWTTYHVCVDSRAKTDYSQDNCTNTTTDEDTPGPPAIIRIQSTTSDSLLVVWEPPEKPRGIITNYNVTWNTSVVAGVTGNITQYNITSLEACTLYNIIVKAATIKGYGDRGDARGSTDGNPPEATQKVSCVLPTSPHDLTVSWSSIMSSCPVLRYTVNYTGHVLWSHDNTHGSRDTDTIYVDLRNLTPWTAYNVCVAGVIVNNIVGAWNCCQATTPESAPGPPASLNLTDKSSSRVKVCWDEPVQLNGELTLYQLIWGANNKSLSHNLTSYTISGLQSNSLYNVTLQAGTEAGVGPPVWDAVTTDKGVNVGGIVAGVVVGVLLLALIVAAVVFRDKLKDKMKKRTTPTIPPQDSSMTPVPSVVHDDVKMRKQWQVEDDQRGGEEFTPRGTTAATTKVFYTTCSADHVYVNTDCGDDEDNDHVYTYLD